MILAVCGLLLWYYGLIMVTLNAHFDGKTIVPDEPLALAPNQKLRVTIEMISEGSAAPAADRVPGLQRGLLIWMSHDFNEHLGDDFWGISDSK